MNKVAGNIFGLLVIAGIVIYFVTEAKKTKQTTKQTVQ